jgi:phosphoribosylanthranilate isomerase
LPRRRGILGSLNSLKIKICGITRLDDARAALDAGADAIGFIFYPQSKRYITPEAVGAIVAALPSFVHTVGVTVNLAPSELAELARVAPLSHWQLHGDETSSTAAAHQALGARRLIKVLPLPWTGGAAELGAFAAHGTGAFLLDTPSPEYGGTGRTFDWDLVAAFREKTSVPLILSGGLTADNVAEAIARVHPYGVDVSSGVESAPGIKDHAKLRHFIAACRQP